MSNLPPLTVFCDFDGTITTDDTFARFIETYSPKLSQELLPKIYHRQLTLKEGIPPIVRAIPSQYYEEAVAAVGRHPLRSGLEDLLLFLEAHQIPFIVISGGLKDMVRAALQQRGPKTGRPLIEFVTDIVAADIDASGEFLRMSSDYVGETEMVAKVKVMALYPTEKSVMIGDSVTDINMALRADVTFARDSLIRYMTEENHPYLPWDTFDDVRQHLENLVNG